MHAGLSSWRGLDPFVGLTFIVLVVTSCPFHGWLAFVHLMVKGSPTNGSSFKHNLGSIYVIGSALEMLHGLTAGFLLDKHGPLVPACVGFALFFGSITGLTVLLLAKDALGLVPITLWWAALLPLFSATCFISMSAFVLLDGSFSLNSVSTTMAATQYLSSLIPIIWKVVPLSAPATMFLYLLGSLALVILWLRTLVERQREAAALAAQERFGVELCSSPLSAEEHQLGVLRGETINDSTPPLWNAALEAALLKVVPGPLPPGAWNNGSPRATGARAAREALVQIRTLCGTVGAPRILCFGMWYIGNCLTMIFFDVRFSESRESMTDEMVYCTTILASLQGPLSIGIGLWLSSIGSRHESFALSLLCLLTTTGFSLSLVLMNGFPRCSAVLALTSGGFVYGSKYWTMDALIGELRRRDEVATARMLQQSYGQAIGLLTAAGSVSILCNLFVEQTGAMVIEMLTILPAILLTLQVWLIEHGKGRVPT